MFFFKAKKEQKSDRAKEKIRAHIFVSGRVQGVLFRLNTKKKADKLGVSGWVRNLSNGQVEAIFEGEKASVEEMLDWARKGPIWAKVDDFSVVSEDYRGEFKGFEIRRDLW